MITEQLLQEAGYRRHERHSVCNQYADFFYQLKVKDKTGIQYFIEFWHYPPVVILKTAYPGESWMFEIVLNEPHSTFQMHRVEDIEQCEAKADAFWRMMGSVYYELNAPEAAAVVAGVGTERDWPEDFALENGNYQCRCVFCYGLFMGHKRRFVCRLCDGQPAAVVAQAKEAP